MKKAVKENDFFNEDAVKSALFLRRAVCTLSTACAGTTSNYAGGPW